MSNPNTAEEIIDKYRHKGTTSGISRARWGSVHIRKMIKEHTAQTLDRLEGKVEEFSYFSGRNEFHSGYKKAIEDILQLIKEVSDE